MVNILYRNFSQSSSVTKAIEEQVKKLERMSDLISCHVCVSSPHKNKQKGNKYHVSVKLRLPHTWIVVTPNENKAHEDIYLAIGSAFAAVERKLETYLGKKRSLRKGNDKQIILPVLPFS